MKKSGVMESRPSPMSRCWFRWVGFALGTLIVLAGSLFHLHVMDREMSTTESDLLVQLVGTRDALQGMDPYSATVTRDIREAFFDRSLTPQDEASVQRFYYPATMVVLLAPLAHVRWETVRIGFLCLMPLLLGGSAFLWTEIAGLQGGIRTRVAIAALFVVSWPVLWALRVQQPTAMIAVLIAAAIYCLRQHRDGIAGVLLAVSTVKPQLVGPLLLWLLVWAVVHRRWRWIASFGATALVLLAASEWLVPEWIPHWLHALPTYDTGKPALEMMMGRWVGSGCLALLCVWSGWSLWRRLRADSAQKEFAWAAALLLALAVTVMPTRFPLIYNQVMVFPAVLMVFFGKVPRGLRGLVPGLAVTLVGWDYLAVLLAAGGESLEGPAHAWDAVPFLNILLPAVLVMAMNLQCWPHGRTRLAPQVSDKTVRGETAG